MESRLLSSGSENGFSRLESAMQNDLDKRESWFRSSESEPRHKPPSLMTTNPAKSETSKKDSFSTDPDHLEMPVESGARHTLGDAVATPRERGFHPRATEDTTELKANSTDSDVLKESLIEMATETWRISKSMRRVLTKLNERDRRRFTGRVDWFVGQVEVSLNNSNFRIVNVEGQDFDPGMAATPINLEDFNEEDKLVVDQMIEPIIMGRDGLVRHGKVTLQTGNNA